MFFSWNAPIIVKISLQATNIPNVNVVQSKVMKFYHFLWRFDKAEQLTVKDGHSKILDQIYMYL